MLCLGYIFSCRHITRQENLGICVLIKKEVTKSIDLVWLRNLHRRIFVLWILLGFGLALVQKLWPTVWESLFSSLIRAAFQRFLPLCSGMWDHTSQRWRANSCFSIWQVADKTSVNFSFPVRVFLAKFQSVLILVWPFFFLRPSSAALLLPVFAALSNNFCFLPLSHWRILWLKYQLDDDLCFSWHISKCSLHIKMGNVNLVFENRAEAVAPLCRAKTSSEGCDWKMVHGALCLFPSA